VAAQVHVAGATGRLRARAAPSAVEPLLQAAQAGDRASAAAAALLAAHNRARAKEGRKPLALSAKLCEAAALHARDMAEHHQLEHKGSHGSTVPDRVKRLGYHFVEVGENIARGESTVQEAMDTWMNSPGHRKNILADFSEMGGARADDDNGVAYWCVDFGAPIPRLKPAEAAAEVVTRMNRDRAAKHRPALKIDPNLARAALALSTSAAAKDSLKIEGDPLKDLVDPAARRREFTLLLSANAPTAVAAAKSLVGDDGARLEPYREIGVGYAIAKSGTPYWCAILAKPAPALRSSR
jgi:uncharacterized protein YkwD